MRPLLIALFGLLVFHPVLATPVVLATLTTGVVIASVFVLAQSGVARKGAFVLAVLYLSATLVAASFSGLETPVLIARIIGVIFHGYTTALLLRALVQTDRVTTDMLFGAACVYLLFSVFATNAFVLVELLRPGAFLFPTPFSTNSAWVELQYFSLVTLTGLGYGDIQPIDPLARTMAVFVAVSGAFYLTFLVARLVAVHIKEYAVEP